MTNLVVDASVVIKWFVAEPLSVEARRILDDYQSGTLSLVAPDLINAEIGNIVWKKQTFQGLGADDAKAVIDGFRRLEIAFTPTAQLLGDADVGALGTSVKYNGLTEEAATYFDKIIDDACVSK
jgi:predicted nucleic acid-binding protein